MLHEESQPLLRKLVPYGGQVLVMCREIGRWRLRRLLAALGGATAQLSDLFQSLQPKEKAAARPPRFVKWLERSGGAMVPVACEDSQGRATVWFSLCCGYCQPPCARRRLCGRFYAPRISLWSVPASRNADAGHYHA